MQVCFLSGSVFCVCVNLAKLSLSYGWVQDIQRPIGGIDTRRQVIIVSLSVSVYNNIPLEREVHEFERCFHAVEMLQWLLSHRQNNALVSCGLILRISTSGRRRG